jgi:Cu2+-exporting ATPase/Cu+-exporting ATPase
MAIVACPCAFAFATPLALSVAMGRCAKNGILVKGADVIEKLAHVDEVVLDKTGTLTTGEFTVQNWMMDAEAGSLESVILALELRSSHPIGRALVEFLKPRVLSQGLPEVLDFKETIGLGVSGTVQGHKYSIQGLEPDATDEGDAGTYVGVYLDDKRLGTIVLGDSLRADSVAAVNVLRKLGLKVGILSGDCRAAVLQVARKLGIESKFAIAKASPEAKSKFISALPRAVMVGDGANDAVALASAYVGIAVHSGMEISMRAADVYQREPGVTPIVQLVQVSRETLKVIYRNFAFSLIYNFIGMIAAISGQVSPLFAAVLMPISALTVFASSIVGTRRLRSLYREMEGEAYSL